ncbi:Uncharacterised protein [Vibrio cholerae]|uniref:Uncharacterized protein n=1 Tax=Vibrio cholerae TaxID=666 RepID=A0A656A0J3_VIBCL|nr:Uncharacterised protein [Vibrio cholerae]
MAALRTDFRMRPCFIVIPLKSGSASCRSDSGTPVLMSPPESSNTLPP